MAQYRSAARRTIDRRGRQLVAPDRILLRRDRRRPVEDDRRRHYVEAGHRRTDQELVGRRGRGRGIESGRGLHRHGRDRIARQHHAGRRRLQVHRRREDVEARRPRQTRRSIARIRIDPTNPDLVYVAALRRIRTAPNRRARRVPVEGRRQDVAEDPVPRRQDRRGRSVSIRTIPA